MPTIIVEDTELREGLEKLLDRWTKFASKLEPQGTLQTDKFVAGRAQGIRNCRDDLEEFVQQVGCKDTHPSV